MSANAKPKITAEMREGWDKALRVAAGKGDLTEIRRLRNLGANMKGADENGWTVLHWAAMSGNVDLGKYLCYSAKVKPFERDKLGYQALVWAIEFDQSDFGMWLFEALGGTMPLDEPHLDGRTTRDIAYARRMNNSMYMFFDGWSKLPEASQKAAREKHEEDRKVFVKADAEAVKALHFRRKESKEYGEQAIRDKEFLDQENVREHQMTVYKANIALENGRSRGQPPPEVPDKPLKRGNKCQKCEIQFTNFPWASRPRVLDPCGHKFCTRCTHQAIKRGKLECPSCGDTRVCGGVDAVKLLEVNIRVSFEQPCMVCKDALRNDVVKAQPRDLHCHHAICTKCCDEIIEAYKLAKHEKYSDQRAVCRALRDQTVQYEKIKEEAYTAFEDAQDAHNEASVGLIKKMRKIRREKKAELEEQHKAKKDKKTRELNKKTESNELKGSAQAKEDWANEIYKMMKNDELMEIKFMEREIDILQEREQADVDGALAFAKAEKFRTDQEWKQKCKEADDEDAKLFDIWNDMANFDPLIKCPKCKKPTRVPTFKFLTVLTVDEPLPLEEKNPKKKSPERKKRDDELPAIESAGA